MRELQIKVFAIWSLAFYATGLVYAFHAVRNIPAALAAAAVAVTCIAFVFQAAMRPTR